MWSLPRQGLRRCIATLRARVRVGVRARATAWVNTCTVRHYTPSSSSPSGGGIADRGGGREEEEQEEDDVHEVAVFWDFENCPVPSGLDPFLVRRNIERALRRDGLLGPITFRGYGNINVISRAHVLEALSETGVGLHHVPHGGKNSSDRALLIDMLLWTIKHSPPAHLLLISGDSDFSILLHKMRMLSYDVLLAASNKTGMSPALVNAANRVWVWPDIALGHNVKSSRSYSDATSIGPINRNKGCIKQGNVSNTVEVDGFECSPKSECEDMGKGDLAKLSEAQCLPSIVVNKIIDIVEESPGISLGDISKELRHLSVNPRSFGFTSFYHLLISMKQLQTRFIDGLGMKDRVTFYLANESKGAASESELREDSVGVQASKPQIKGSSNATEESSEASQNTSIMENSNARNSSSWLSWLSNLFRNA